MQDDGRQAATFDVGVIGGGTAGVVAAVQAARAGARTLLVERSSRLGGTMTNGDICAPGLFHAWGRQIIAGIGWELVARAACEGQTPLPDFTDLTVPFHAHQPRLSAATVAAVFDDAVLSAGVDLRLHTMAAALERSRGGWRVTLCDADGLSRVACATVVDATGDATAVRLAGGPVEDAVPCQPSTLACRMDGYDPAKLDLPALDRAFAAAVAAGEVRAEDACWRTDRPSVAQWLHSRGQNANHIATDASAAGARGRTALEVEGRRGLHRLTAWLRRQPGLSGLRLVAVAPEVGVRETRRIVGEATITIADYESGRAWPDAIGHAFYPIDWHGMTSDDWRFRPLQPGTVPSIPREALRPRGCPRLLAAGRTVSSDRLANSALRVQAACMAMGQAAGAWAALAARSGTTLPRVPIGELRALLRAHGAIVPEAV